jgi:hypothetical protein
MTKTPTVGKKEIKVVASKKGARAEWKSKLFISHYANANSDTSFCIKKNENQSSSKSPLATDTDCDYCHLLGHTKEECRKYGNCDGCKEIHSKKWKGCPYGGLLPIPQKSIKNNGKINCNDPPHTDKITKKKPRKDPYRIETNESNTYTAKKDSQIANLAKTLIRIKDSLSILSMAVNTVIVYQANTLQDIKRRQTRTSKLTSRTISKDHHNYRNGNGGKSSIKTKLF